MPYIVVPPRNGLKALAQAPMLHRCEDCQAPIQKWRQHLDLRQRPHGTPPLSETEDGFLLASQAFYKRYFAEGWVGLGFRPLANGFYLVTPERRVRLLTKEHFTPSRSELAPSSDRPASSDTAGYVVHHTDACDTCGRHRESQATGEAVIARGEVAIDPKEFTIGDLELGQGDGKAPILMAGEGLRLAHLRRRIQGTSIQTQVTYEPWSSPSQGYHHEGQVLRFPGPN